MPKESQLVKHPKYMTTIAKLLEGKITLWDAARELNTEYNTLWHHVRHGLQYEATDNKVIAKPIEEGDPDDYVGMLKALITKLNNKVNSVIDSTPDRPTSLIRELRGCINDLLVIQGQLQSAPLIQLNRITIQYNKLTSELATNLCPICRKKILEVIQTVRTIGSNGENN